VFKTFVGSLKHNQNKGCHAPAKFSPKLSGGLKFHLMRKIVLEMGRQKI